MPSDAKKPDWEVKASKKRQALSDCIPEEWRIAEIRISESPNVMHVPETCGILTKREITITNTTNVGRILQRIQSREWSAYETTLAFCKRACIAHQLTNCLTEILTDRALDKAKHLDEVLEKTGDVVGLLHGLPISLKDQFTMKGIETVMGYVSGIDNYATEDSVLVQTLEEAGAVLFVRTNVPQTLMWGETHNNVFGRTLNPYNRNLTPGGSSGGEGALLALRGSPLGVGTDIGGSLRIPSAFCGLYTLRPSYGRLPYYGAHNALLGQESISSVLGPMANSLSGVEVFMKAIIGAKSWNLDPLVIRKPWDGEEYGLAEHGGDSQEKKLAFAIMWDNGVVRPHPPLVRAMKMTKAALEASGHTGQPVKPMYKSIGWEMLSVVFAVIDWVPHRHLEIYKNAETIFVADGNHDYNTECAKSGEPLITTMVPSAEEEVAKGYTHEPPWPFVKDLVGHPPHHRNVYELWKLHEEKRHLRKSHLDHWNATAAQTGTGRPVDAIISPAVAYTAVPHGLNTDSFYTTLCNAMDYTTSVFTVTYVDSKLDLPVEPHEFYNHEDEAIYKLYKTDIFDGCPVGLQLIGKTLEEEAVLRMTYIVTDALEKWKGA
ncbi:hypothetical protein D9619_007734 [Psilocybe cf. subviscida]|uniref:amidase n=1 Tax=Psilocybe cf. subviscida TaxID=2480587 RepID=A0A8H5AUA5_9AGAR|nr:hypothetical protein D9619_007734 [Psilocybe cf. subviscida]